MVMVYIKPSPGTSHQQFLEGSGLSKNKEIFEAKYILYID